MYSECLPFTAIPHSTRLFIDFLYHFDRVQQFYPEPPRSTAWIGSHDLRFRDDQTRRWRTVAEILVRQNRRWGASQQAIENARRLGQGSRAIVTGQQVGLFGGPAYAIYKALTAIRYAQEFTRAGVECVPVFWMATEDHDFAEINHVLLPSSAGIQKVEIDGGAPDGSLVGTNPLGPKVNRALEAAAESFGSSDLLLKLRDAYQPDATFGSAFARFIATIFSPYGLVLMDPSDRELHALSAPIYSAAVERSAELNREVQERGRDLESAGYHQQVKVTSGTSFLFALEKGIRKPILRSNNGFDISGKKAKPEAILELTQKHPELLSPNALLRSSIQDFLLPTVLYIGGPAEIAYWAQSAPLQQSLLGRVTPITHRLSATLVESAEQRLFKKYGLSLPDLFSGPEHTRERLAARVLPAQLQSRFATTRDDLSERLTGLQTELEKLDHTLVDAARRAGSKMCYQLERLRGRAARAELRRNEEVARHADRLSSALYPNKALQERVYPGAYYLARYGDDLLSGLLDHVHIECPDHQVVSL